MSQIQCHDCRTERDITTEGRLARMEAKLESIDEKLDDAVLSQLRDHGKRLAAIERRWWLLMGYMVGSGIIGAAAVKVFM